MLRQVASKPRMGRRMSSLVTAEMGDEANLAITNLMCRPPALFAANFWTGG